MEEANQTIIGMLPMVIGLIFIVFAFKVISGRGKETQDKGEEKELDEVEQIKKSLKIRRR